MVLVFLQEKMTTRARMLYPFFLAFLTLGEVTLLVSDRCLQLERQICTNRTFPTFQVSHPTVTGDALFWYMCLSTAMVVMTVCRLAC